MYKGMYTRITLYNFHRAHIYNIIKKRNIAENNDLLQYYISYNCQNYIHIMLHYVM